MGLTKYVAGPDGRTQGEGKGRGGNKNNTKWGLDGWWNTPGQNLAN